MSIKTVRLDLGCEEMKKPGFIGIDIIKSKSVDVIANLVKTFPFKNSSIDVFYSNQFIEHIEKTDFIKFMEEVWRTGKKGSRIIFSTPYETFRGAELPVHHQKFNSKSFCIFEKSRHYYGVYSNAEFKIKNINMWFNKQGIMGPINNIIEKFANRFPDDYENNFRFLFPAHRITYEMRVVK